jgi:hypothetical protein
MRFQLRRRWRLGNFIEMNRKKVLILSVLGLPLLLIFAGLWEYRRIRIPLDPANGWTVEVQTKEGKRIAASIFEMRGRRHVLFVKIEESFDGSEGPSWFSIDVDEEFVADPGNPGEFLYLHFNHDKSLGVTLNDPKMGDSWWFGCTAEVAKFGNQEFKAVVKRK